MMRSDGGRVINKPIIPTIASAEKRIVLETRSMRRHTLFVKEHREIEKFETSSLNPRENQLYICNFGIF